MIRRSLLSAATAVCGVLLQGCTQVHIVKTIPAGQNLNQVRSDASNAIYSNGPIDSFGTTTRTLLVFESNSFSFTSPANSPDTFTADVYAFLSSYSDFLVAQLGGTRTGITNTQGAPLADSIAQTVYDRSWPGVPPSAQSSDEINVRAVTYTVKDTGVDSEGLVSWGRWTSPITLVNGVQVDCCSDNKSLHYIFGTATPNSGIPLSGLATYNLIGNTSPTLSDGSAPPGTLTSGVVGVVWGGATANTHVAVDIQGTIGGNAFQILSPPGNDSPIVYNPATRSFSGSFEQVGNPYLSSISGFFAGATAQELALTYSTPATVGGLPSATVSIQGAAAFRRQ